jgi:hypothetical protein
MKDLKFYDFCMIGYVFLLLMTGAIFLGHEIALVKVGSELRQASKVIEACNKIIVSINK